METNTDSYELSRSDINKMIIAVENVKEELFYKKYDQELKIQMAGIEEAGENFADYFYMTTERFTEELNKESDRAIYWDNGWRKKTSGLLIWVVSQGPANKNTNKKEEK